MRTILEKGWNVIIHVDDDLHLNIYIKQGDGTRILQLETGQGDGEPGEQFALRFTTEAIEESYLQEHSKD